MLELDELYWFIKKKPKTETCENAYVFTMVSREPRLLVGIEASCEKKSSYIQKMVDNGPDAEYYDYSVLRKAPIRNEESTNPRKDSISK